MENVDCDGVLIWELDNDGLPICPVCQRVALQRLRLDINKMICHIDFVRSNYCPNCGEKLDREISENFGGNKL